MVQHFVEKVSEKHISIMSCGIHSLLVASRINNMGPSVVSLTHTIHHYVESCNNASKALETFLGAY